MGGETWTNFPDMATYASTGSVAAVASDLAAHTSATNPHGITAQGIGAAAVEDLNDYLPLTGGVIRGDLVVTNTSGAKGGRITSGKNAVASGSYSTANGEGVTASAQDAVASGYYTTASGFAAHARCGRTTATKAYSEASGYGADSTNDIAYVWSGLGSSAPRYGSHGNGSWNIEPEGGLDGMWVGETNMSDHIAAAVAPVEARVGALEELHEKPETCTLWWTDSTMSSGYNYLPTNYTTRNLRVIIYSTNGSRSISMPTSFVPSKATKVEVLLYLVGTPSIVMRYGTKSIQSVNVSSSSYRRYEFSWDPVVGVWTLTSHTQNTSSQSFSGGSVYDVPPNAPSTVYEWEYMLEHGVLPPSNQLSMSSSPSLVPGGGLSPAIIQPDDGSLEDLDALENLDTLALDPPEPEEER